MTTIIANPTIMTVRVQRLLPFGILVSLEDNRLGIIREREIAWDHWGRHNWRRRFKVGDVLQAVLLGEGHDQRLEFSLRLAENDPWITLQHTYALGQLVEGTVTGVQTYGAFVEIVPGITGLLHVSRLPTWAHQQRIEQIFWIGDRVKVVIEKVDPKNRHIGLSVGRALNMRWQGMSDSYIAADLLSSGSAQDARHADKDANVAVEMEQTLPPWHILIVEDDVDQLEAMARWMTQASLHVRTAQSAEEAFAALEQERSDLVLTDFGLPGQSGIEIVQLIRQRWPEVRCALMTDWTRASEHSAEIEKLRAVGMQLLLKPLSPADITALLLSPFDVTGDMDDTPITGDLVRENAAGSSPNRALDQRQMRDLLGRLCKVTRAIKAVIFSLDPAQRVVSVLAEAGSAELNLDALVDLIHSPVRDVSEDRQVFRVEDARLVESRVRYLKPLLSFRSCLGLQLPTALPEGYALFLFSARPYAFNERDEEYTTMTALALAALVERMQSLEHATNVQRLALLGQLTRALVHEMNHQLSPINFVLGDLKRQIGVIEQSSVRPPHVVERERQTLREIVHDLNHSVQNLTDTARMFGRVTMQTREQLVRLDDVVTDVVHLLRDMADRMHIHLYLQLSDELPPVYTQAVQLQQILLNITINAIQQIDLTRPGMGGRVQISVEPILRDQRSVITIRVEDDGPGIHRQLWSRIFDLGFTTRAEGGSGLGLYITRSLTEALNGKVYVLESAMLWGSIFIVELPVTPA